MTLVVDASAIVALIAGEPEARQIAEVLAQSDDIWATSMNIAEAGLVLILRDKRLRIDDYRAWLDDQRIKEFDSAISDGVLDAYLRYGKGVHRARLNVGDCFAYALAKALDAPLLFKGDDFIFTDVKSALQPM